MLFRSALLKEAVPAVFSYYSSPHTRKCANRFGFHEVARSELQSVVDEEGRRVLPKATKDDIISLMVLKL